VTGAVADLTGAFVRGGVRFCAIVIGAEASSENKRSAATGRLGFRMVCLPLELANDTINNAVR